MQSKHFSCFWEWELRECQQFKNYIGGLWQPFVTTALHLDWSMKFCKGIEFVSGMWVNEVSGTQKNRFLKSWEWHYYRTVGFYFVAQCGISLFLIFNSRKLLEATTSEVYTNCVIQSIAGLESFGLKGSQFHKHLWNISLLPHFLEEAN